MHILAEIISVRRDGRDKKGKSAYQREADGKLLVLKTIYSDDGTVEPDMEHPIAFALELPDGKLDTHTLGLRKGIIVQLKGELDSLTKTLQIFRATSLIILPAAATEQYLKETGLHPQQLREELIKNTEGAMDSLLEEAEGTVTDISMQDTLAIGKWLYDHKLCYDLDTASTIKNFFSFRAASLKYKSVLALIKDCPLVLSEMRQLVPSFSVQHLLDAGVVPKKTRREMQLFAKFCSLLQIKTQDGNSFLPMRDIIPYLSKDLEEMGYHTWAEKSKALTAMVKKHNFGKDDPFKSLGCIRYEYFDDQTARLIAEYYSRLHGKEYYPQSFYGSFYLARSRKAEKMAVTELLLHMGEDKMPELLADVDTGRNLPDFLQHDDNAKQALRNAFSWKTSAIVGAAGSGKSTLIGTMVNMLQAHGIKAVLLAPSAMASAVAADHVRSLADEAACVPHMTIHKFARMIPEEQDMGNTYEFNIEVDEDALPSTVKFLIVDETSMCTVPMLYKLLKCLHKNENVHIVFVGDSEQLPAIGPQWFYLLADTSRSGHGLLYSDIPVSHFTENHRANTDTLAAFVQTIRNENRVELPADTTAVEHMDGTPQSFLAAHPELAQAQDTLFIAPTRELVGSLNRMLMKSHLGEEADRQEVSDSGFYIGEKVIATRNDYADKGNQEMRHAKRTMDVYNGTIGTIKAYDAKTNTVTVTLALPDAETQSLDVPYKAGELVRCFEPAYTLTVHKAQGSQAKTVAFFFGNSKGITKAMLYTAATRAEKKLYLIGKKDVLEHAAQNQRPVGFSALAFRLLKKLFGVEDEVKLQRKTKKSA